MAWAIPKKWSDASVQGISPRPYVFTKCARIWDEQRQIGKSLKAASVRAECEASLRRLKLDCIDLYQIHWPEPDEDVEEGWTTWRSCSRKAKSAGSASRTST